jgi:hypothetical protein
MQKVTLKISGDIQGYYRAQELLSCLKVSQNILQKYQPIKSTKLELNKDITEENWLGQSSDILP